MNSEIPYWRDMINESLWPNGFLKFSSSQAISQDFASQIPSNTHGYCLSFTELSFPEGPSPQGLSSKEYSRGTW